MQAGKHDEGHGAPRRSGVLRRLTTRRVPTDAERIAAVAAGADVPVEDVLRDVHEFRLALETDMIIAAAAVDADAPELLSDVVDGERNELATFHDRLMERLADAAADDEIALRRSRRPSRTGKVARLVAAAAAAAAVLGAGGTALVTREPTRNVALDTADQQYADFSSAITSNSPSRVKSAAQELHQTLSLLIEEHANDPEVARRTAQFLQGEISLLQINDPVGAAQVLAEAQRLVARLKAAAPPQVQASVAPVLNAASPKPTSKPKPKATTTVKPSASPTPKATPTPTSDGPLDPP